MAPIRPELRRSLEELGMVEGTPPPDPTWLPSCPPLRSDSDIAALFRLLKVAARPRPVLPTLALPPSRWPSFNPPLFYPAVFRFQNYLHRKTGRRVDLFPRVRIAYQFACREVLS